MSDRVSRITIRKKDCGNSDIMFDKVSKQIRLLLETGHTCFVSFADENMGSVSIEFAPAVPLDVNQLKQMVYPCWLLSDELDYLADYQLKVLLDEAEESAKEIREELEGSLPKQVPFIKKKKGGSDA